MCNRIYIPFSFSGSKVRVRCIHTKNLLPNNLNFGEYILERLENNISKVLIGNMPSNNHIIQSKKTLIKMLNSLSISLKTDRILINFIKESVEIDFKKLVEFNGNKLEFNNRVSWLDLKVSSLSSDKGGTYVFYQQLNNTYYVGSASTFQDRVRQHRAQFRGYLPRALHKSENSRLDSLYFSIVHVTPNFYRLFVNSQLNVVMSQGYLDILMALTLYSQRILEQALIQFLKPTINKDLVVYHRYTS